MKTCNKCRIKRPLDSFGLHKGYRGGYRTDCNICRRAYDRGRAKQLRTLFLRYKQSIVQRNKKKGMGSNQNREVKNPRNLSFDLSFDEFMSFWQEPCHYCGRKIEYIGLDRVDNNDGYNTWNTVSCCNTCNWMKKDFTVKEFIHNCLMVTH